MCVNSVLFQAVDHNKLVHQFWLQAWRLQSQIRLERVESKKNLSDLPSREQYTLLKRIRAIGVRAAMPAMC